MRAARFGRLVVVAVVLAAAGARPRLSHAQEAPARRGTEWVGVELTPVSIGLGTSPYGVAPRHRLQGGPGGTLRLLRRGWERAYLVPIELGAYLGNGDETVFVYAAIEGGVMLNRWDLGLAAGVGILSMSYPGSCDGRCALGGVGPVLAPVARYRFLDRSTVALAALVRVVIPLHVPEGEWFGHYTGRGELVLAGVEIAFR